MERIGDNTTSLQLLIDRSVDGDEGAYDELIEQAFRRLEQLTQAMLKNYPRLKRWEETSDVQQMAMIRLHRSLREVRPRSAQHFFKLANTQIRRTLIDLARHYYGVQGHGSHHSTIGRSDKQQVLHDGRDSHTVGRPGAGMPEDLVGWTAFHEAIELLPEQEREAFEIVWYGGQTVREAATVLGVSLSTVVRRLNRARLLLHRSMDGEKPSA